MESIVEQIKDQHVPAEIENRMGDFIDHGLKSEQNFDGLSGVNAQELATWLETNVAQAVEHFGLELITQFNTARLQLMHSRMQEVDLEVRGSERDSNDDWVEQAVDQAARWPVQEVKFVSNGKFNQVVVLVSRKRNKHPVRAVFSQLGVKLEGPYLSPAEFAKARQEVLSFVEQQQTDQAA